jgi:hypothetical protein
VPTLACWSCGRRIYTPSRVDALSADERRCPSCGVLMNPERRDIDRREQVRRQNTPDDPGPPPETGERRVEERRRGQRRRRP